MFGFFGAGKKQDSPAQPQNTQPQRIIEKEGINSWPENRGTRQSSIIGSFGTDDLDMVLERYAPEHSDALKMIPVAKANQQIIYDKLKEQDKKIEEQGRLLKEQSEAIAALQEQLKMQAKWNEMLNGKLDSVLTAVEKLSQK